MGEQAELIVVSLHLNADEAGDYGTVKDKLDVHFVTPVTLYSNGLNSARANKKSVSQQTASTPRCIALLSTADTVLYTTKL